MLFTLSSVNGVIEINWKVQKGKKKSKNKKFSVKANKEEENVFYIPEWDSEFLVRFYFTELQASVNNAGEKTDRRRSGAIGMKSPRSWCEGRRLNGVRGIKTESLFLHYHANVFSRSAL